MVWLSRLFDVMAGLPNHPRATSSEAGGEMSPDEDSRTAFAVASPPLLIEERVWRNSDGIVRHSAVWAEDGAAFISPVLYFQPIGFFAAASLSHPRVRKALRRHAVRGAP
jgi:hypothetical protein